MKELKFQPRCFCTLGIELNALVDKKQHLSFDEFYSLAEKRQLFKWISKHVDTSLWDEEDKLIMEAECESFANATDSERQFGITENALVYLVSMCFEYIQHPPTRTLTDL